MLFVYFIGTEIYLRMFVRCPFWVTSIERNTNDKISVAKKRRSPNHEWTSYGFCWL